MAYTADFHRAVPFSILTCQVVIVSAEHEALITEELNHSAMGEQSTRGWVAGVAPVIRFREGEAC